MFWLFFASDLLDVGHSSLLKAQAVNVHLRMVNPVREGFRESAFDEDVDLRLFLPNL